MKHRYKILTVIVSAVILALGFIYTQSFIRNLKKKDQERMWREFSKAYFELVMDQTFKLKEQYKKQIMAGDEYAMASYYTQLVQGKFGVPVDWEDLHLLLAFMHGQGSAMADWYLSLFYNTQGDETRGKNKFYRPEMAYEYLEKSAMQGYNLAQFGMARLYESGAPAYGFAQDRAQALFWRVVAEKTSYDFISQKQLKAATKPFNADEITADFRDQLSAQEWAEFTRLYQQYQSQGLQAGS